MSRVDEPRRRQVSLGSALLRRGWLLIVCAVAVGALAYGIAKLQSATYSSEAVLNVPASLGPSTPGSAQQAASLAAAYSRALPSDDKLTSLARKAAGSSGSIHVSRSGSMLTIGYNASTRSAAIKGASSIARAVTKQRPETQTVAAGTLQLVHRPDSATRTITGSWRANARLLVSSGAGPATVSADNSNKLAQTLADILSSDDSVAAAAAHAVHRSVDDARSGISVTNDQDTSLVRVRYKDKSARKAAAGARAIARAVSGEDPASSAIQPGSLQIVSLPKTATTSGTIQNASTAIPIGAALGLVLGLVLLMAWERSDPHVMRAPDLSRQIGAPATPVDRLSDEAAHALLERWASLAGKRPARVAIMPATRSVERATDEVVDFLLEAGDGRVVFEDRRLPYAYDGDGNGNGNGHVSPADADIVLVQAGAPGGAGGGEAVALDADLTVVVIPKAMKAADLRMLSEDLSDFGIEPSWALLISSRRGIGTRPRDRDGAVVG